MLLQAMETIRARNHICSKIQNRIVQLEKKEVCKNQGDALLTPPGGSGELPIEESQLPAPASESPQAHTPRPCFPPTPSVSEDVRALEPATRANCGALPAGHPCLGTPYQLGETFPDPHSGLRPFLPSGSLPFSSHRSHPCRTV